MPINTPTSSIESNTEKVYELLSNKQVFEAISNVFFKRYREKEDEIFFDNEEERRIFITENISLIIYKLNNPESFNIFLTRLQEIYSNNNDQLGDSIIEKLKFKKFIMINKGSEITNQLVNKDGDIINGVSTNIILLANKLKVQVFNLLEVLLNRHPSYFERLDTDLHTSYSENGITLGESVKDCVFIVNK